MDSLRFYELRVLSIQQLMTLHAISVNPGMHKL